MHGHHHTQHRIRTGVTYVCLLWQLCTTAAETEKVDGRAVRRSLNATGRYVRQPTKDEKSQALMEEHGRLPVPGL